MNRRTWLASLSGLGVLAVPSLAAADSPVEECAEECEECVEACSACVEHCIDLLAAGKPVKECLKSCLDCVDICDACSKVSGRNGPLAGIIATACAAACERCAVECEKHKGDKIMAECAEQCRKCAKDCKAQAK
jgi:hypothetical protein